MTKTIEFYDIGTYVNLKNKEGVYQILNYTFEGSDSIKSYFFDNNIGWLYDDQIIKELTEEEYNLYLEKKQRELEEKIKGILDVFKEVFNEEDYDYTVNGDKIDFLIKYSNIKVENKIPEFHIIPELFVRLTYNTNSVAFESILGFRSILTYDEYSSGYNHSHLSTGNDPVFKSFCWGSDRMGNLKSNIMLSVFNLEDLRLFLFDLFSYLSWENLDSSCYAYISEITSDRRLPVSSTTLVPNEIHEIIKDKDLSRFISFNNGLFEIQNDIEFLREVSINIPDEYKCYYDLNLDTFSSIKEASSMLPNDIVTDFKFKGENIVRKVIDTTESEDLSTYYRFISPVNIELIKNYLKKGLLEILKKEECETN